MARFIPKKNNICEIMNNFDGRVVKVVDGCIMSNDKLYK